MKTGHYHNYMVVDISTLVYYCETVQHIAIDCLHLTNNTICIEGRGCTGCYFRYFTLYSISSYSVIMHRSCHHSLIIRAYC